MTWPVLRSMQSHRSTVKNQLLALSLTLGCAACLAANEEGMFLELKVNQTARGELLVYRSDDGDFLVRQSDLAGWGLRHGLALEPVSVDGEGEPYVSLRSLGPTRLWLDTARMELQVELPGERFETSTLNLSAAQPRSDLQSEHRSGFLNYRLAESAYGSADSRLSLATEWGLRYGDVLLLSESLTRQNGDSVRYLTQLVYDRVESQQRLIAGDFIATSGELGSVLPMGGLNFSKVYGLTPGLVTQPLAGFAGVANTPSVVEVRMGGVPVASSQVPAGPFELQNLRQYSGASDVEVVVRDALGREQEYSFPFYFAEGALRAGLQEYSYSLGKIRSNPGQSGDSYGSNAFAAFHRFGYSDALTLGARAEAAQDLSNAGLQASWRSDRWGLLSGALSTSNYQGVQGDAGLLSYTYLQSAYGLHAIARRFSDGYAPLQSLVSQFNTRAQYGAGLSFKPSPGVTVSLDHTLYQTRNQGDTRTTSLGYFQNLGRNSALYATLQHTDQATRSDSSLFVGWFYYFENRSSVSANAVRDNLGNQTLSTQLQHDIPYGEGLGYRLGWTGTQPQPSDRVNAYAQWNLPAVILSLDASHRTAQGSMTDSHELAVAGSIAFADGAWGAARPITDSFAIVDLGAPVAGVHVLANNQDVGTSGTGGQVVGAFLGSFYESQIAVNEMDVPLNYAIGRDFYTVKPAYRSGVRVNFGLRRVRALDGVIRWRNGSQTPTADDLVLTLSKSAGNAQTLQIGRAGYFYVENLEPGSYQASMQTPAGSCSFTLQVPDSPDIVSTLPNDLVCQ